MKIKPGHKRDFSAYLHWYRNHLSIAVDIPAILPGEASALRVFVEYDSQGRLKPTRQPRLLRAVLLGKADLNRQIKDWADGLDDVGGRGWLGELRDDLTCLPDWVYDAIEAQSVRNRRAKRHDAGGNLRDH